MNPPTMARLHEVDVPTLLIVGDQDLTIFKQAAVYMQKAINNASMVIIPQVGHMSNMENPVIFNQTMLQFIGQL
ncbi:alpha/beta hydrolase [Patescibacteria group bacterium]|nr:alpha/beta hydrolase [Patescibacteria group bacterium]